MTGGCRPAQLRIHIRRGLPVAASAATLPPRHACTRAHEGARARARRGRTVPGARQRCEAGGRGAATYGDGNKVGGAAAAEARRAGGQAGRQGKLATAAGGVWWGRALHGSLAARRRRHGVRHGDARLRLAVGGARQLGRLARQRPLLRVLHHHLLLAQVLVGAQGAPGAEAVAAAPLAVVALLIAALAAAAAVADARDAAHQQHAANAQQDDGHVGGDCVRGGGSGGRA